VSTTVYLVQFPQCRCCHTRVLISAHFCHLWHWFSCPRFPSHKRLADKGWRASPPWFVSPRFVPSPGLLTCMFLGGVRGSRSTWREPMHTQEEHANPTQKGPKASNLEPSCCEAAVLTTTPPCSPKQESLRVHTGLYQGQRCTDRIYNVVTRNKGLSVSLFHCWKKKVLSRLDAKNILLSWHHCHGITGSRTFGFSDRNNYNYKHLLNAKKEASWSLLKNSPPVCMCLEQSTEKTGEM